jgi:ABC-type transport system involved in cytochrome bd biosynthesis fused ATPase/permease subunit
MLQPPVNADDAAPALRLKSLKKAVTFKKIIPASATPQPESQASSAADLVFKRGERVAIVDPAGISSRLLMEVLAGNRRVVGGSIVWDSAVLKGVNLRALAKQVAILTIGPSGKLPMSPLTERFREISIAAQRHRSIQIYVEPDTDLGQVDSAQVVSSLCESSADDRTTVIVTTRQGFGIKSFDRVIQFDADQIVFDGTYSNWARSFTSSTISELPVKKAGGQTR